MTNLHDLMATRRWCYYLDQCFPDPDHPGRYRVSIVVENESGHFSTGGGSADPMKAPWFWDEECCRLMNARRGLSEEDCIKIVSSSMAAGRV